MMDKTQQKPLSTALRGALLLAFGAASAPLHALEYEFGEFLLNVDVTLGYAAQWRTESRRTSFEEVLNDNDGNNSFDAGSMTSSKLNGILELGGEYRDFSFFIRGDAIYDYVYADGTSDMSRENYLSFNSGRQVFDAAGQPAGSIARGRFPRETIEEHGRRIRLLDMFAAYSFNAGDMGGSMKLGRQVISWGEATFYPGVNAIQNPIDSAAALAPGTEAKEVFLPTSAFDLVWDFTTNLSAEAYYKLKWEGSTLPGVGSYLSTSDITGPGSENLLFAPGFAGGTVGRKIKPEDDDQYGIALRYITDGGTNFDLTYTKSHANIPGARVEIALGGPLGPEGLVQEVYSDDIKIWGLSFSTNLGEAQVYADLAYSENMPFVDLTPQFLGSSFIQSDVTRGHYYQAVVGMTDIYTAFPWLSESIVFLAEAIYTGNNLGEGSDLDRAAVLVTDDAWGFQGRVILNYYQPIRGMDVQVPITFRWDVDGYGNSIALNNGLKENVRNASIGFDAFYLTNWQFSGKYAWFWGNKDPDDKTLDDRDNISFSVKYRF